MELLLSSDLIDALAYDTQRRHGCRKYPWHTLTIWAAFQVVREDGDSAFQDLFVEIPLLLHGGTGRSARTGTLAIERASVGARVR